MKDFFELLGQPRRPWLESHQVKEAFVAAAAIFHPDRVHDAPKEVQREAQTRYSELNEAQHCLSETRSRLRHLLELERGCKAPDLQDIPEDLLELFRTITQQVRETDQFLKERAQSTSPLLKVALFERAEVQREALHNLELTLRQRVTDVEGFIRKLDENWIGNRSDPENRKRLQLGTLEELYRLLSFYSRWLHQTRTRMINLME